MCDEDIAGDQPQTKLPSCIYGRRLKIHKKSTLYSSGSRVSIWFLTSSITSISTPKYRLGCFEEADFSIKPLTWAWSVIPFSLQDDSGLGPNFIQHCGHKSILFDGLVLKHLFYTIFVSVQHERPERPAIWVHGSAKRSPKSSLESWYIGTSPWRKIGKHGETLSTVLLSAMIIIHIPDSLFRGLMLALIDQGEKMN